MLARRTPSWALDRAEGAPQAGVLGVVGVAAAGAATAEEEEGEEVGEDGGAAGAAVADVVVMGSGLRRGLEPPPVVNGLLAAMARAVSTGVVVGGGGGIVGGVAVGGGGGCWRWRFGLPPAPPPEVTRELEASSTAVGTAETTGLYVPEKATGVAGPFGTEGARGDGGGGCGEWGRQDEPLSNSQALSL